MMLRFLSNGVLVILFVFFTAPAQLWAQKFGDQVVVIRETEIKLGDKVVDKFYPGSVPMIQDINGDWLWVDYGTNERGWNQKQDVRSLEEGIQWFTEEIRRNPEDATAYSSRGNTWNAKGEYDIAIKDMNEAIRLDPDPVIYYNRGLIWFQKGDYDKAIDDFDETIRLSPSLLGAWLERGAAWRRKEEYDKSLADYNQAIQMAPDATLAYSDRGIIWERKGEYDKAIADYNQAIQLNPKCFDAYSSLALLQATCPDAKHRDGKKAMENAKQACEMSGWKDSWCVDSLAAAYAENGDFVKALDAEEKALKLAKTDYEKKKFGERQECYRQKKPYRQTPKK